MIELRNITKLYVMGDEVLRALDNVSFTLEKQEFAAVIGPSGSGKSTLMNIVGCLDIADEGKYFLDGIDVSTMRDDELAGIRNIKVGFIFQQFNLIQKLTAYENVELPLIYQGIGKSERHIRVIEALERVDLGQRIKHRPNELSGGQQQRVAIARALATKPSLILADEPTGNLDSKSSRDIMALMHELHRSGNTIMMITHDPGIAAEASRAISIMDGKIISDTKNEEEAAS